MGLGHVKSWGRASPYSTDGCGSALKVLSKHPNNFDLCQHFPKAQAGCCCCDLWWFSIAQALAPASSHCLHLETSMEVNSLLDSETKAS